MIKGLAFLFFISIAVQANEYNWTNKRVLGHQLQEELKTAGFSVREIRTTGNDGVIVFKNKETRNPQAVIDAHVFESHRQKTDRRRNTAKSLLKTIDDEATTTFEIAVVQLLKLLIKIVLGE